MSKRTDRLTVPMTIEWSGKSNRKNFLKFLLETNNFTSMIEVGVMDGRTTFFLLDQLPNLTIQAIDTNIKLFYNQTIKEKYGPRLIPLQGLSEHIADQIPNNSVDLVFIDANHNYEFVKKDILKYKSKLKPGGILCGHDIDYPGVNRAVNELLKFDVGPNFVWVMKNG